MPEDSPISCKLPLGLVTTIAHVAAFCISIIAADSGCVPDDGALWQNRSMKRPFSATIWREGDWFVAQCLDVDVASQGQAEEEALDNLREALELHFEPPVATHPPTVRQIEVEVGAA